MSVSLVTRKHGMVSFQGNLYDPSNLQSVILAILDMKSPGWTVVDLHRKLRNIGIFMSVSELVPLYEASKRIIALNLIDQV
jgi:hypothetical protein